MRIIRCSILTFLYFNYYLTFYFAPPFLQLHATEPTITDRNLRKLEQFKPMQDEDEMVKVAGRASVVLSQWLRCIVADAKRMKDHHTEERPTTKSFSSHHALPMAPEGESPRRSSTPCDATVETEELKAATAEIAKLDTKEIRDLRNQITSVPTVGKVVQAVQAALAQKDTSPEAGQRLVLNPKAFQKSLADTANDPAKCLKLSRAEFLALQKALRDKEITAASADVMTPAVVSVLRWAKCAHAYASKFQKAPAKV